MKKLLLKTMLLLCALIAGSGTMWADDPTILFHETFGNNTSSARTWDDSYSVKSGVSAVYSGITGYTVSNVKQGKNTTGSTQSGLNQSTTGTDAYIVIGPLNVADYKSLGVTYQWKAGSTKGTYTTKLEYATSSGGSYSEVSGSGTGATTFVERSYSMPAAAQVSTLYLKITWNTSNTQAIIDEVELTGIASGGGSSAVATTTTIDASGITYTDAYVNTAAGSLTAVVTVTEGGAAVDGATVTWSGDNDAVATINEGTGAVTLVGAGTVTFTANYAGVENEYASSSDTYELTVTSSAPYVQPTTINITPNYSFWGKDSQFSGDTYDELSGEEENVTLSWSRGNGSTYANTTAIRFYKDNDLTFTAPTGYEIKSIKLDVSGTYSDLTFSPSGYDNETTTWTGSSSTVTMSRPSNASSYATITKFTVTLAKQKELSSIALSGTYPTVFEEGDEFSHEGAVVTATYDDASEAVVTASAIFSTPDMASAGAKTVTVSYTENAVEKTTTYDITVKAIATLESIALSGTYPTTFNVGDEFSHEGMTVTANFDDSSNADVTALATFTGYDMSAAGVQTVTVSYTHKGVATKTKTYDITVNTVPVSSVTVAPISATVKIAKTVTLIPTIGPDNATNKNVTWESSNSSIATVDGGVVTGVAAGEATITVKSVADPTKQATCTITVITAGDGSKAKPYDVEEALEIISGYSSGSGSAENFYTKGIVSSVGTMYNSTMLTYFISIDGTGENTIQVFRGKNLGNTNFAATSDISVNDEVIVYGQLYKYNSTSEINSGNYIYSLNGVKIPEITFGEASYEVAYNGSLTITATADCSGAITYSSSDDTVAEINATTGVVTPHKAGAVTITANVAASVDNIAGSKEVALTITDGRAAADIEFAEATISKTWGEAFTGQELTNSNSVAVTYESSVPAVATVNESGVVTIIKAGETVITASFAGDEDYMDAEASYTLTVNKAAAGLSFDVTAYDFDLNDDSFTGAAVNNPNSLTVTYASSDEDVAIVIDEETGELILDASTEGTVTITASFAGNDWYNAGNASYTITIVDPDRKGSKTNPYTVAEVIDGTATGSDIYVRGFIVGEYVGKTTNPRTSGFTTDANIAISEAFTNSPTASGSIPVALPSDALKSAWGCKTTSGALLGYEVLIKGDVATYFSVNGIKNTDEVSAVSVPVTVGTAGYTTYTSTDKVTFPSGVKGYIVTATGANTVTLVEKASVPASTPIIIEASAGTYNLPVITTTPEDVSDNILLASDGTIEGDGSTIFALGNKSGVGFYLVADGQTVPAGKAYLSVPAAVKGFLAFDFGNTDAIKTVQGAGLKDAAIFNLAGQRMSRMHRGVNLVNGKKIILK